MSNGMGNDRFKPDSKASRFSNSPSGASSSNDDDDDMFGDFEFTPLTDGLGFHKKAQNPKPEIKTEIKNSQLGFDASPARSSIPETPAARTSAFGNLFGSPTKSGPVETEFMPAREPLTRDTGYDSGRDSGFLSRPASQSISDLIASLPPSLDFVDSPSSKETARDSARESGSKQSGFSRPQIFQPIAREDFKTPGPTIGSVLPTPGTRAGRSTASGVSMAPVMSAPLIGSGIGGGGVATPAMPTPGAPAASQYRDKMNESYAKAFPQMGGKREAATPAPVTQTERSKTVAQNMPGAILDGMVVLGISTIFLVCILAITHVNLMGLLTNANTDVATQFHLGLLFVAVLQMYMLTARSFFGASLGEWAFDLQIGTVAQQRASLYPLQIAWRTMLITLTGFFVIPVLSMIFKRDLAMPVTGVELIHRP